MKLMTPEEVGEYMVRHSISADQSTEEWFNWLSECIRYLEDLRAAAAHEMAWGKHG